MDPAQVNQNQAPNQAAPAAQVLQDETGAPVVIDSPRVVLTPEEWQQTQAAIAAGQQAQTQNQLIQGQIAAQAAQAAYEAEKNRVMESEDPRAIEAFFEARRQAEHNDIRNALAPMVANGYRNEVVQRYGLRPEQAMMLGEDPNLFDQRAQYIQTVNNRDAQLNQLSNQNQVAFQAQQRALSNHDRIGGVHAGGAPIEPDFEKGSLDHLRYRLFGDGQQFISGPDD